MYLNHKLARGVISRLAPTIDPLSFELAAADAYDRAEEAFGFASNETYQALDHMGFLPREEIYRLAEGFDGLLPEIDHELSQPGGLAKLEQAFYQAYQDAGLEPRFYVTPRSFVIGMEVSDSLPHLEAFYSYLRRTSRLDFLDSAPSEEELEGHLLGILAAAREQALPLGQAYALVDLIEASYHSEALAS